MKLIFLVNLFWSFAYADTLPVSNPKIPQELQGVGITENLGKMISIAELSLKDETDKIVLLSQYFKTKKPVLLGLVYYECPNLCHFLLNGILTTLKKFPWTPGNEFEFVLVSIDPKETANLALNKKESYLNTYNRPKADFHFLTGSQESIQKLALQIGFNYRYDAKEKQFAHPAALYVLTDEGKISRYLYGVEFKEQDLRLALVEASKGKVGTVIDRILLFCYRYDPKLHTYSLYITRVVQLSSAFMIFALGLYLTVFWIKQRGIC
ncbi:MAG: SCO family protein [Bdellovibrio sp.]|nr:SCO family protein [Bdellovibrio sp.]